MEIKLLEDFISLARTKNFSRSAEERFVTQPAFSRRIKALEAWAGTPLLDRDAFPIGLTAAGVAFKETAEESLRGLYMGRDELSAIGNTSGERIIISTGQTLSLAFVPEWLLSIRERLGQAEIRIVPDNLHECVQTLIRGDCDFMITYCHGAVPLLANDHQYPYRVIGVDRLIPVSIARHNGDKMYQLPGESDNPIPYLAYPDGVFLGRVVENILENCKSETHLQRCFENPMAEGLKYMVLWGHGLAWLPESSVVDEIGDSRLTVAGDASMEAALEIRIYRRPDLTKKSGLSFWELLG